jgi:plastocyanin
MSLLRIVVVAASLVSLAACGTSYSSTPATAPTPGTPATSGSPSTVAIPSGASALGSQAFPPNPLTVDAGTTVTWMNTDSIAHTSTSDGAGWDSGIIAAGAQYSVALNTAGTFHYHCQIHPGMIGTVVVR